MQKVKRVLCVSLVLVFTLMMISFSFTASAYRSSDGITAPERLDIYVGYWGGPYTIKAQFTRDEVEHMPQYEGYYSYVTRVGTVMLQYAKGPTLETILDHSGIDKNSVRQFDFYTVDVSNTYFTSKGRTELLDTTRYYYPHIRENGESNSETQTWVVTDYAAAVSDAQVVPTIIATDQVDTKDPTKLPEASDISPEDSFRLCSGQVDASTPTAFESAKWIHAIYVVLSGTPPTGVRINEGDALKLTVGSKQQLSFTLLGDSIADTARGVTWKSSDPSIVKVDALGRITVLAEGEAVITATTVNGLTASIVINSKEDPEEDPNKEDPPPGEKDDPIAPIDGTDPTDSNPPGTAPTGNSEQNGSNPTNDNQNENGNNNSSGTAINGISDHSDPSNTTDTSEEKKSTVKTVLTDPSHVQSAEESSVDITEEKKELKIVNAKGLNQILVSKLISDTAQEEAGAVAWRTQEMEESATALGTIENDNIEGEFYASVSAILCFTAGIGFRIKKFFGDI